MLNIILIILTAGFIFEAILEYLNIKNWSPEVPELVKDIYSNERYTKARAYAIVNYKFSQLTSSISFAFILFILMYGAFGWLDEKIRIYTQSPVAIALAFFGILAIASDILSLPFSIYRTFIIEEKFGFNKTTAKTFILDKLKGYLLMIVIGGILLSLLVKIFQITGHNFWWISWIILTAIMLLITVFYTSWILPIFNKLTPLMPGDLRKAIEDYSTKNDFPLSDIFVMDGSKRSSKANAFFSGLGTKKKIVLYDTLVKEHSTDELVAVLAHETGHFKLRHIRLTFIVSILQTGLMLFVFSLLQGNPALSEALGAHQSGLHLELLAFALLYSPLSTITGILMHMLSRKNEFEADDFAKKTFNGKSLVNALKKLSADNLSNLTPHPLFVFVHYSHPPLLQRLQALEN
jgi:STE24 endopeptidase